jgi:hypothetical protein
MSVPPILVAVDMGLFTLRTDDLFQQYDCTRVTPLLGWGPYES